MLENENTQYVIKNPELAADFKKIESRSVSNRMRTIEGKIDREVARPDQIYEWYIAQDPLHEKYIKIEASSKDSSRVEKLYEDLLTDSRRYEKAARLFLHSQNYIDQDYNLTEEIKDGLSTGKIDTATVTNLLIGEELLSVCILKTNLAYAHKIIPGFFNGKKADHLEELGNRSDLTFYKSQEISGAVKSILDNPRINDPKLLMLGMEGLLKHVTSEGPAEGNSEEIEKYYCFKRIENVISGLRRTYLDSHLIKDKMLEKSELKGRLLEHVWLLDAYVFNVMSKNYRVEIFPTIRYQDMPKLGHPQHRRGSDIYVYDQKKGHEFFVQLKSSTQQSDKKYHPTIVIAAEQNFLDINPGRLELKLRAYLEYINNDFNPEKRRKAFSYLLPTVVKIFSSEEPINMDLTYANLYGLPRDGRPQNNPPLSSRTYQQKLIGSKANI